jgi:hypothetical protein
VGLHLAEAGGCAGLVLGVVRCGGCFYPLLTYIRLVGGCLGFIEAAAFIGADWMLSISRYFFSSRMRTSGELPSVLNLDGEPEAAGTTDRGVNSRFVLCSRAL